MVVNVVPTLQTNKRASKGTDGPRSDSHGMAEEGLNLISGSVHDSSTEPHHDRRCHTYEVACTRRNFMANP